jgi:hypothetical protein
VVLVVDVVVVLVVLVVLVVVVVVTTPWLTTNGNPAITSVALRGALGVGFGATVKFTVPAPLPFVG